MSQEAPARHVFQEGEHALVFDRKGRRYMLKLEAGKSFHTHLGNFGHDDLIGQPEGTRVETSRGHSILAFKPTMSDFTRLMPRIATIVYPKDLGAIITLGDIFPGARVVEAGSGSGAVTIALLRAVGTEGRVFSYDMRADMIERTSTNVAAAMPEHPQLEIKLGDISESIAETDIDRVVLDLPEPWHVVPTAHDALVPGGVLLSFLPTILQVHDLVMALKAARTFDVIETVEILSRPWSVGGRSVRPAQRMVGHTGFIVTARKCEPLHAEGAEDAPEEAD
jgi:tRNA (adenine57-N1/adenine58-N1)-methyltransferase